MSFNPLLASTPTGPGPAQLPARVLQTMPWGVLALDRHGCLQLLNPAAALLLGYPADYDEAALLGQPLAQVLPAGFPAELLAALHAAHASPSSVAGEFFLPYCQQWVEMTVAPGEAEVLVYWQVITRLVAKRQQYQALAENTPDALARWDTDGCLRYANPAMEAKVGQPLAALLGKTLREIGVPPPLEEPYAATMQRVFATGQPQRHPYTLHTPQGEQHYQAHLVPEMHDGQVHTVLSIAHNITELRQAELAVAAQAYFSAQLATASPDRILVRELATDKVLYVNRAVLPEVGYDPDEAVAAHQRGERPFPGAPTDEAALTAYWQAFTTATDQAMPVIEHRLRALDGTWHWYRMRGKVFARDAQGQPTQALSVAANITAAKEAEAALRESYDLLQAVFNATLDSLEVLRNVRDEAGELLDFEWVLTNEATHRLAHRSDLVGKRLLAEEPAMQESGVFERLRQVVKQGHAADFEQHYPYDGADEWFHVSAAPLGDGLVMSWHDITARKQATAELLRLQLAQQQQLANTVLAAQEVERRRIAESLLNGVGQLLYATKMRLDALGSPVTGAFEEGKRQTAQLLTTAITQVRMLSHQLIPVILEDFGLATAVHEICREFSTSQLLLRCTIGDLPPLPLALALALYRMAQELASNLVKHAAATEAHLHLREQAGWLELRATDNGHGFDPAQPLRKGLGLNALRDRVQLLGGQLTISSSAKQGTQITIRVPCPAAPAA